MKIDDRLVRTYGIEKAEEIAEIAERIAGTVRISCHIEPGVRAEGCWLLLNIHGVSIRVSQGMVHEND